VTPRTNATKGAYLVKLGWFDPISKQIQIEEADLKKWLDNGAKPTNSVAKLLIAKNIKHKLIKYTPSNPAKAKKKGKTTENPKAVEKTDSVEPTSPKVDTKKEEAVKDSEITENINQEAKKEEV